MRIRIKSETISLAELRLISYPTRLIQDIEREAKATGQPKHVTTRVPVGPRMLSIKIGFDPNKPNQLRVEGF